MLCAAKRRSPICSGPGASVTAPVSTRPGPLPGAPLRRLGTVADQHQGFAAYCEAIYELAERIVRRHRLAERFLTDILDLSWADAHRQANRWEHVIDENVEAAMDRVLGQPTTCPHGNPIPGSDYHDPFAVPLNGLDVGAGFTVTRIPEELEFTPGVLDFLEENTVLPGRSGILTATSPDGSVTVRIDERVVGLGTFASSRILVLPGPAPA